MLFYPRQQRERKRQNSDRSEEGYHSDGDYPEQDYREEPGEEKESKTIMLRGLSLHVTEGDVSSSFSALDPTHRSIMWFVQRRVDYTVKLKEMLATV